MTRLMTRPMLVHGGPGRYRRQHGKMAAFIEFSTNVLPGQSKQADSLPRNNVNERDFWCWGGLGHPNDRGAVAHPRGRQAVLQSLFRAENVPDQHPRLAIEPRHLDLTDRGDVVRLGLYFDPRQQHR